MFQSVTAELSLVKKGFDRHRGAPPMLHRDNPCSLLLLRIQWQWAMLENSAKTKEDMAKKTPEANQAMEAKTKDIMANWLVRNQKTIAELPLVDMPSGGEGEETGLLPLDKFVDMQVKFSEDQTATLSAKSIEIEHALKDLIVQIMEYPLSFVQESVDPAEIAKLSEHFSTTSYKAVQDCTRLSLETIKGRIAARSLATFLFIDKPLFEVSVEMTPKGAKMNPELGEIQTAINTVVRAVLSCSKQISLWENDDNYASGKNVFDVVSKDKDVVRVVLMLTGALEGVKRQVYEYMHTMTKYDYLWKDNKKAAYNAFMSKDPSLEDFEAELKKYDLVEHEIMRIPQKHNIGAIVLETLALKTALSTEAKTWKKQYAQNLHGQARTELATITEWIEKHTRYLKRELNDLDDVRVAVGYLAAIREKETMLDSRSSAPSSRSTACSPSTTSTSRRRRPTRWTTSSTRGAGSRRWPTASTSISALTRCNTRRPSCATCACSSSTWPNSAPTSRPTGRACPACRLSRPTSACASSNGSTRSAGASSRRTRQVKPCSACRSRRTRSSKSLGAARCAQHLRTTGAARRTS